MVTLFLTSKNFADNHTILFVFLLPSEWGQNTLSAVDYKPAVSSPL